MNVLIIAEDQTNDRYLLEPLIQRLYATLGQPRARVDIVPEPRLRGINDALNLDVLRRIVNRYRGRIDHFILCVDRDGDANRRFRLDGIEKIFAGTWVFLAENAWEELETWALAGLRDFPKKNGWFWRAIRSEVSFKERYFEPLARDRGLAGGPGGGREELGDLAARNIATIRQKCREDFDRLATRIEAAIAAT